MKYSADEFLNGIKVLSKRDSELRKLFKRHDIDFEPQLKRSPYESLVRAIAHQQLHGKAAETILGRMIALFPKQKFPTSQDLIKISSEKLRKCGFSNSKVRAIKDIASKADDGTIPSSREISKLSNEEIVKRLTSIYGVGRWTVEMMLIFQLGRLDVWPIDDFGVRRGFQVFKGDKEMLTAKELKKFEKDFSPFQSIVALYLWREADLFKEKLKLNKKNKSPA